MSSIAILHKLIVGLLVILVANPICCCGMSQVEDEPVRCCAISDDGDDEPTPSQPCQCGGCKKDIVGAPVDIKLPASTATPDNDGAGLETSRDRNVPASFERIGPKVLARDARIVLRVCQEYCVYRL